ncbi:nucleotidyl transferase AbiEii/AbiGii toxin family protein [Catenibacterium sp.]|uniref:nucleotidyl transferase AbiEii/AbiGii toxin family protein n=1 Tax=Catenibacterium sp. TaxID=2049022 RepID=UPI003AB83BA5
MQNFMLERLLERISISKYHHNFVLKGGFLIAAMVGIDTRATMDMDATIKDWPVNEESIKKMFLDICNTDLHDNITFEFKKICEIREGDKYTGYRVSLSANYPPMAVPLKLDITTGDKVTPEAIRFRYRLLLEDKEISVLAYNLETIMAEKLESIVSRGDQNSRLRDYYDVYILMKLQYKNIEPEYLKAALDATSKNRGTSEILRDYKNIIAVVKKSGVMNSQWRTYQKNFEYAADISFDEVCDAVVHMMDMYSL